MVDWNKELIKHYMESGLSQKEAEYLNNAIRDEASYQKDDYAKALQRRASKNYAPQAKVDRKEFMDSFKKMNDKPMTTERFFDKSIEYSRDPGAGKVSEGYLEAIKKQRIKDGSTRLTLVPDDGMANIKGIGANAAMMALGYLVSKTPELQLDIKDSGEGSDTLPPDIQQEKNRANMARRQAMVDRLKK
jgi:hypothetical protein